MDAQIVENIVETKEFSYEYQAVDEYNRPLGAKQIFKGSTIQEVLDKVAQANKNLIKLNRELNRRVRLGDFEKDTLPNDAAKITSTQILQPRELSIDEKAQFARDILDPEKFDDVNNRLVEAQLGAKPEEIRNRINSQEQRLANIEARQEAEAFVLANPDYYTDVENFKTITAWMVKNGLKPVRENFQLAYDTLKGEGLMIEAPLRQETPAPIVPPVPPVVPPVAVAPVLPVETREPLPIPEPPVRPASGLTRDFSSTVGTPPAKNTLTIRDIERMPSEEYKRRLLTDKTFARAVDELYTKKQPVNDPRI
jgi:hypothetical protein